MRVFLYGEQTSDALGASFARAFSARGHSVSTIDAARARAACGPLVRGRIGHRLTLHSLALRRASAIAWNAEVLRAIREAKPELVFVLNGELVMPETIDACRAAGVFVAIFHADNPFPPHYNNRAETIPSAVAANLYLTWSPRVAEDLRAVGAPRVEVLPFAWDEEVFPPRPLADRWLHDVTFIGGWDEEREKFLDAVAARFRVKVWGPNYWGERTRTGGRARAAWQGGAVRAAEAAQVIADSGVVLNILRGQHVVRGSPSGTIMRHFEVPGVGGVLLSTRTELAVTIFPEGKAGAYFEDLEGCLTGIDRLLSAPTQRREMAAAAHDIVACSHRYEHRVDQIVAWCASGGVR